MRDFSQTQCKDAERSEGQSASKSDAKCKNKTREKESGVAAEETVPDVREARERKRARRLHQTVQCQARQDGYSQLAEASSSRKTVPHNSKRGKARPRARQK